MEHRFVPTSSLHMGLLFLLFFVADRPSVTLHAEGDHQSPFSRIRFILSCFYHSLFD